MSRSVEAPRRDSFKLETEEWVGLHDRATTGDDLSTTMRDKVQSCKSLEDMNRVGGAQNGDGARKANVFRARGGRTENHGWGRRDGTNLVDSHGSKARPLSVGPYARLAWSFSI